MVRSHLHCIFMISLLDGELGNEFTKYNNHIGPGRFYLT